jgi:transcriptional regulator with XRE-family HTH domain
MSIGNRIRQARQQRGYSQEYLAEQLDLSQGGYRKIETDEVKLKVDKLLLLADLLKVDVDHLLYEPNVKRSLNRTGYLDKTLIGSVSPPIISTDSEHELLIQLLISKEAHLLTLQKLISQYEKEIGQLQSSVTYHSVNVSLTSVTADKFPDESLTNVPFCFPSPYIGLLFRSVLPLCKPARTSDDQNNRAKRSANIGNPTTVLM